MSNSVLSAVMDRFMTDEGFRSQMRSDPEAALRGSGLQLSSEDLAGLLQTDWGQAGEELSARVSKGLIEN
jgi:hypothetical protein